jgi:hypothetical protein
MSKIELTTKTKIEITYDFWAHYKDGWVVIDSIPSEVMREMKIEGMGELMKQKAQKRQGYTPDRLRLERVEITTETKVITEIKI